MLRWTWSYTPNVIIYSAAISACDEVKQPDIPKFYVKLSTWLYLLFRFARPFETCKPPLGLAGRMRLGL